MDISDGIMNVPNRVAMCAEHKERNLPLKIKNLTMYSEEIIIRFIIQVVRARGI
jgi:hypothetical protein